MKYVNDFLNIAGDKSSKTSLKFDCLQKIIDIDEHNEICETIDELIESGNKNAILFLLNNLHLFTTSVIKHSITNLLTQNNPIHIKECLQAIEKLPKIHRIEFVLDLVKIPNFNHNILIKVLSLIENSKEINEISPLIKLLITNKNMKVLNKVISIFKTSRDERCIKPLINLTQEKNIHEEILELFISALGELSKIFKVKSKIFKNFLNSKNSRVRKLAIWSLSQYGKLDLFNLIIRHFKSEKSPIVRNEILKNLQNFSNNKNAEFLFEVLKNSTESNEKLLSESSLASLPINIKGKVFRRKIKDHDSNTRALAIRQISTLSDPNDIPLLIQTLKTDRDENVREQAAEVLGLYESKEIDDELYNCMKNDESIAYSAVLSICQSYHTDKQELFIKMLDENIEENILTYQTILSYLPKHFKIYKVQPSMIAVLLKKLKDNNANIRYLSIIALGESGNKDVVQPLINSLEIETVNEIKNVYLDSIINLIGNDYHYLLRLLDTNPDLLPVIMELIFELDMPINQRCEAFLSLFTFSANQGKIELFIDQILNFTYNDSDLSIYLSILSNKKTTEEYAIKISDFIKKNISEKLDENISELTLQLFNNSSEIMRKNLCPILSKSTGLIRNIFKIYENENDTQLKGSLHRVLLNLSMR